MLLVGIMQAVPTGHGLGNLVFLFKGLGSLGRLGNAWVKLRDFHSVLLAGLGMTIVHCTLLAVHGASLREFEAYGVWLLWPFILMGLIRSHLCPESFVKGVGWAALLSGVAALIDLFALNQETPNEAFQASHGAFRIAGFMTNPIVFGNISLLFATLCLYLLVNRSEGRKNELETAQIKARDMTLFLKRVFSGINCWLIFSLGMGLLASLLSGTKGGWVAAMIVWPLLMLFLTKRRQITTLLGTLASVATAFVFAMNLPMSTFQFRISSFHQSIDSRLDFFKPNELRATSTNPSLPPTQLSPPLAQPEPLKKPLDGEVIESKGADTAGSPVVDSSITPRLVQWRLAFSETSAERLFIGMPRAEFIELQRQALALGEAEGLIRPWRNLHNDLIDVFITKGVLGLLSLLVFVVLLLRFFYCRLNHDNHQIRSFAGLGLLILLMVGLYSISDVQMDKGAVTHTLSFILLCLVALILQASSNSNT
jgi:O-antigen ligase